jgi:membrane-bound lytic murein transglycosylase B
VRVESAAPGNTRVVLLLAQQQDGPTYRVGFDNFHALTRYNHSALYAMAVDELARAIVLRLTPPGPGAAPEAPPTATSGGNAARAGQSAR